MDSVTNKDAETNKKLVIEYYERSHIGYRLFWYGKNDLAMHYGFWGAGTTNRSEALINENRFLAEKANIKKEDRVLDAGCGVGGSSIWLARTVGCSVLGISIAPSNVREASENAKRNNVSDLAAFELRDYMKTDLPDETFNGVWAIESFCHAPDKKTLFLEMHRLLKPGGRIIVADGFQKRPTANEAEECLWQRTLSGLGVYQTQWWDEYREYLRECGFKNILRWDMTGQVKKTVYYIFWLGILFTPIALFYIFLEKCFGRRSVMLGNWRAAIAQRRAFEKGLWLYGVYYAEK
ncbi:MAG: methyltransferase domain-containing protein [Candidatus Sungbacteria bacterium]|nr:methyltransferase domain-containing protein [Candidatus Sungbacteria bacterium]